MAWSRFRSCTAVGVAGLCLIFSALIMGWLIVPKIVRSKIAEILPLRPNTESWDRWEKLPVPIQFRVFFLHMNNPDEVVFEGKKPRVTEVGPYVYREKRIKKIISVDEANSRVFYEQTTVFEFDQQASGNLSDEDVHTVPNIPATLFALMIDNIKNIEPVIRLFNTSLAKMWPSPNNNPFFIQAKVKDYLLDGVPMLCNQTLTEDNMDVRILCEAFRILHPKTTLINDLGKGVNSFAFFKYKNKHTDGVYEVDLGVHDVTKIGNIRSWNNLTLVPDWKAESCKRVLGTDGTVFRPYLQEDNVESLYVFNTDICRSLRAVYDRVTEYKGVTARRYIVDKNLFASTSENPENYCFCPQSIKNVTHVGGCLKSGILELSSCQGSPIHLSHPHFLMADSYFQSKVEGFSPDRDKHQIFLDLEPNTGYPLRAASRIQLNVFLKRIPEVELMKNLPNVMTPAIWIEEIAELTDELIAVMNAQLLNILRIENIIRWLMIGVGISLSLSSCGYYFFKIRPKRSKDSKSN